MANYYSIARSNYFRVKDYNEFKDWIEKCFPVFEIVEHEDNKGTYALLRQDFNGERLVSYIYFDEEGYEDVENIKKELNVDESGLYEENIPKQLAEYLAEGEVAIFFEIGNEKMRYLDGYAIAVNSAGDSRMVTLDSIYEIAKELGNVTSKARW